MAAMPNKYTIYLENQGTDPQTFWCFLAPPQELAGQAGVFANSSAQLEVAPNSPATNIFGIPVQYKVGAGASNNAVGLGVQITSSVVLDAELMNQFNAAYANVPPPEGPTLSVAGTSSPANTISISSNAFNKGDNEANGWFSNQSFGIETESGFIGMTWSPDPQTTRTLTPTLTFYVATGTFSSNSLARWTDISNSSATLQVPNDFLLGSCTVTLTATGELSHSPGPPASQALATNLAWFRSQAHAELVALAYLSSGDVVSDTLESVSFDSGLQAESGVNYVSGTITVKAAVAVGFSYFLLSGIRFNIDKNPNGTTFHFSWSGTQAASSIRALFKAGSSVQFGGKKTLSKLAAR
jgi:hypothetical protein